MGPFGDRVPKWPVLAGVAALLSAIVISSLVPLIAALPALLTGGDRAQPGIILLGAIPTAVAIVVVVCMLARLTRPVTADQLGLRVPDDVPRAVLLTVGAALVLAAVAVAWTVLGDLEGSLVIPPEIDTRTATARGFDLPVRESVDWGPGLLASALARCVLPVVAGEILLRGFVFPALSVVARAGPGRADRLRRVRRLRAALRLAGDRRPLDADGPAPVPPLHRHGIAARRHRARVGRRGHQPWRVGRAGAGRRGGARDRLRGDRGGPCRRARAPAAARGQAPAAARQRGVRAAPAAALLVLALAGCGGDGPLELVSAEPPAGAEAAGKNSERQGDPDPDSGESIYKVRPTEGDALSYKVTVRNTSSDAIEVTGVKADEDRDGAFVPERVDGAPVKIEAGASEPVTIEGTVHGCQFGGQRVSLAGPELELDDDRTQQFDLGLQVELIVEGCS